jgi:thiol-disulfide isomerase/thioredoxin
MSDPSDPAAPHLSTRRKLGVGALVAVAIAIGVALVAGAVRDEGDGSGATGDAIVAVPGDSGEPVGEVVLSELGYETFDGDAADLGAFAGRPVVLNFFASWCTPCVAEMPDLEDASRRYDGRVAFVGLAVRDRPEDARRIVADTGVTYPVGLDRDSLIERFQGYAMPSTVFIDVEGSVVDTHLGVLSPGELDDKLDDLGFS